MSFSDMLAIAFWVLQYVSLPVYAYIAWSITKRILRLMDDIDIANGIAILIPTVDRVQHTMLCLMTAVCVVYAILRIWLQVAMTMMYIVEGGI